MNVLYFSGSTLPSTRANAVHVMKMCQAFAKEGVNITLCAKGQESREDIFRFYDIGHKFDLCLSPSIGIPIIGGLVRTVLFMKKAFQVGRRKTIIYGRDLWSVASAGILGFTVVFEAHEMQTGRGGQFLLRQILKAKKLRGIVVISQGLKSDMLDKYPFLKPDQILVAHDGADIPAKANDVDLIKTGEVNAGYAGSLHKGKGLELIIEIAKLAPDTMFHVIGEKRKEMPPCPDNIIFYRHKPHKDIFGYLVKFDVLLAPYQSTIYIRRGADIARWISPLKLFEYMAANKPIICSDIPVLHEIMENGRNCVLISPEQPAEWAREITNLHQNYERAQTLAANAFHDLETKYTWNVRARAIAAQYHL